MIKYRDRKPSLFVDIEVEINGFHIVAKLKIHSIILHRKKHKDRHYSLICYFTHKEYNLLKLPVI